MSFCVGVSCSDPSRSVLQPDPLVDMSNCRTVLVITPQPLLGVTAKEIPYSKEKVSWLTTWLQKIDNWYPEKLFYHSLMKISVYEFVYSKLSTD